MRNAFLFPEKRWGDPQFAEPAAKLVEHLGYFFLM